MTLIEARKPALGRQILVVLRDHAAAAADRRGVVDRLRERVGAAGRDPLGHPLANAERDRVHDRLAFRRLPDEGLHAGDAQPGRAAVRRAQHVEIGAARADVADAGRDRPREITLHVEVPDLHPAEAIVRIHRVRVGGHARHDRRQRRFETHGRQQRAEHLIGDGKGRLSRKLLRDRLIDTAAVVDAVAGAHGRRRLRLPRDADARGQPSAKRPDDGVGQRA